MLSAFKKLTSTKTEVQNVQQQPAGTTPMSNSLQKKFSRGVQYNMKIIIKGDRNVGKSCLLERLQGKGFVESYTPSEEINVASIQWSFKATEDIVKVEVWDVVDRGKARVRQTSLKLSTGAAAPETPALDAEFLDVYKGTHGVILMMDVTKTWTFEYVCRELPKIPQDIPVLILGNHCDMSHHRVVTAGQAIGLIEGLNRTAECLYGESSMRNGFGLRLLHKFLGLPFLRLQKDTLLSLIQRNERDSEVCSFELSEFLKSDDADYNKFLDKLSNKRRQIADSNPKTLVPSLIHSTSATSISSDSIKPPPTNSPLSPIPIELRPTKSIIIGGGQPIVIPGQINITNDPKIRQQNITAAAASSVVSTTPSVVKSHSTSELKTQASGFIASLFSKNEVQEALPMPVNASLITEQKVISVEEFCPDGGMLDKGFLEDVVPSNSNPNPNLEALDSDSDNENGNPLVAKFHDEFFSDNISPKHEKPIVEPAKVNPLAKNKHKHGTAATKQMEYFNSEGRKSSISSDDIEVPNVMKDNFAVADATDSIQHENFDIWLDDTNQRRSPEGGEDNSSVVSHSHSIEPEVYSEKERKHKSGKKKKDKKEKSDREEKKEKKKKRKSKENDLDDFGTSEAKVSGAYEAI